MSKAKKKSVKQSAQRTKTLMPPPKKSKDLPATFGALNEVRSELKSDISAVRLDMRSFEKRMESRFAGIDSRFDKMESRFAGIDSRFDKMESQLAEMQSTNHRMLALLEEQNARNKVALEGYATVYEAQKKLETRVDTLETNQFEFAKYIKNREV